jgi:HD-GYP domain-containing protein (c-di-GMP phosphodiesterase class II)
VPIEAIPSIHKGLTLEPSSPYRNHVNDSLSIIKEFKPETRPRVFTIIQQHHEKFDGTGFPGGMKGFKVDDIAQIVALANMLALFSTGDWDGQPRILREAFDQIESLEKVRTFPEYFNPEVLSTIMKWIKNQMNEAVLSEAGQIVEKQARDLVQKPAA